MATPFDATTKTLVDFRPEDWLRFLGLPPGECQVIDSDLATVSTEADRLIEVQGATPYVTHIEFQSGHDGAAIPERLLRYNGIAVLKTGKPTLSFAILLKPEADSPRLVGTLELSRPDASVYLHFEYGVIRLWQVSAKSVLEGGLATLPLALLSDLSGTSAEAVVEQMDQRVRAETSENQGEELWASAYLLSGLRFNAGESEALLGKVVAQMRESSTYQKILQDGRAEGLLEGERNALIRIGSRRLGAPDDSIRGILERATLTRLEVWMDRLNEVESWQELLAE
jgi:predicted transposase YdaD